MITRRRRRHNWLRLLRSAFLAWFRGISYMIGWSYLSFSSYCPGHHVQALIPPFPVLASDWIALPCPSLSPPAYYPPSSPSLFYLPSHPPLESFASPSLFLPGFSPLSPSAWEDRRASEHERLPCMIAHEDKTPRDRTCKFFSEHVFCCIADRADRIPFRSVGRVRFWRLGQCVGRDIRRRWSNTGSVCSGYILASAAFIFVVRFQRHWRKYDLIYLFITHRLYSCEYSHVSPFLHKPLSQCLHTTLPYDPYGCGATCLSGHLFPWGQSPSRKALQCGRFGSRPNLCSFLRKSANEKSVKDGRRSPTEASMVEFLPKRSPSHLSSTLTVIGR